jgi:hypothetical protein
MPNALQTRLVARRARDWRNSGPASRAASAAFVFAHVFGATRMTWQRPDGPPGQDCLRWVRGFYTCAAIEATCPEPMQPDASDAITGAAAFAQSRQSTAAAPDERIHAPDGESRAIALATTRSHRFRPSRGTTRPGLPNMRRGCGLDHGCRARGRSDSRDRREERCASWRPLGPPACREDDVGARGA